MSLDAGTDATFQAMHKPRQPISLDEICSWVPKIKKSNAQVKIGYSFIVTWRGATREEVPIVENINELVLAAKRARDYQFDYLSVKPVLMRQEENGAEVMNLGSEDHSLDTVVRKIRAAIEDAKMLAEMKLRIRQARHKVAEYVNNRYLHCFILHIYVKFNKLFFLDNNFYEEILRS